MIFSGYVLKVEPARLAGRLDSVREGEGSRITLRFLTEVKNEVAVCQDREECERIRDGGGMACWEIGLGYITFDITFAG